MFFLLCVKDRSVQNGQTGELCGEGLQETAEFCLRKYRSCI